ncbi:caspase family protein [Amycolatopsis sp. H20-H5]|uniref:caspase family protein n=1 Tax=Amycolatopsis sp. H20-H5 TaxID=3046309 RepID=UPI002DBCA05E|nr:caspase family protein [Amycolatopsis sp. H20-H5]MEC3978195.1 caspase family protein [Amycolatopsis sp. H20-H5]
MLGRRALVVGIDDYPTSPLSGCVNDAIAVHALLARNSDGSPNFDVQLLVSDQQEITRSSLRAAIERLFTHDTAEVALLYFSGHGTENGLGGYIVTPDARKYDEGINLSEILTLANKSTAQERVVILDSCMSGGLGSVPAIDSSSANLTEGVSILSASRAGQAAMEVGNRGVFTGFVCSALEGGAADVVGNVHAAAVYSYVEEGLGPWDQRPLFKAHLSTMIPLRKAEPAVQIDVLRTLPQWFPEKESLYPLDPSYEYTHESADKDHVTIFKKLQLCRDAKLVESVDEAFMYFAAVNSTACRLTRLGQHYWHLAKKGRL